MEDNRTIEEKRRDAKDKIKGDFAELFLRIENNNLNELDIRKDIDVVINKLKSYIEDNNILPESGVRDRVYEIIDSSMDDISGQTKENLNTVFIDKYNTLQKVISNNIDIMYDDPKELQNIDAKMDDITTYTKEDEDKQKGINNQKTEDVILQMKADIKRKLVSLIGYEKAEEASYNIDNYIGKTLLVDKLNEVYSGRADNMNSSLDQIVQNMKLEIVEEVKRDYEIGEYSPERKKTREDLSAMFK